MLTIKKKSQKQERRVALEVKKKRPVGGSGCKWYAKGDVKTDDLLIECKTTAKDYYIFKLETWKKINKEAWRAGMRTPLMQIDLLDGEVKLAVLFFDDLVSLVGEKFSEFLCPSPLNKFKAKSFRLKSDFLKNALKDSEVNVGKKFTYELVQFRDYSLLSVVDWKVLKLFL